jgi:L-lactate dehydrogenase complex protein LldG
MNNKEEILKSIRKHKATFPDAIIDYPVLPQDSGLSPEKLRDKFIQSLKTAGADVLEVGKDKVETTLSSLGNNILNFNKPEIRAEYNASCPLEKLGKIECLILYGNFGVAENGAIWIEDKDMPNRLLPFITQHLILQMDVREIVPTMQDAYRRVDLQDIGFGVFISGPSKTADIEQSLVYGAHGAKELTVLLVSE